MSKVKQYLIVGLVVLAILQSGLGGLRDMFGLGFLSAQHGWSDANFLLLLAILVAITMK